MAKGKCKNLTNRNQERPLSIIRTQYAHHSESWIPQHTRKARHELKSYLMMVVKDLKKGINNSLNEIQENSAKEVEALKKETQKTLKELQENTAKEA